MGDHRLHLSDGQVQGLFDLKQDPQETDDLAASQPELAEQLLARYRELRTADREPRFRAQNRPLTQEEQDILKGLGYTGSSDAE